MEPEIDRSQVILYAVRCVVAGAVFAGALALALYLGNDMGAATKVAIAAGGGVLAVLSHGGAYWAQSPKQPSPRVVNITSIAPPAIPVSDSLPPSAPPKKVIIPT